MGLLLTKEAVPENVQGTASAREGRAFEEDYLAITGLETSYLDGLAMNMSFCSCAGNW